MSHPILLSYPRSGNHLVRFLIEYVTGLPTKGCDNSPRDIPLCRNVYPDRTVLAHVNGNAPMCFQKCHFHDKLKTTPTRVLFILRDPLECILNHTGIYHNGQTKETFLKYNIKAYLDNLKYVQTLPKHVPVLTVYYEDLIDLDHNDKLLQNIGTFVGGMPERIQSMLKKKRYLYQQCSRGKRRAWGGYKSGGDKHFYVNHVAATQVKHVRTQFLDTLATYPKTYATLLSRYALRG